MKPIITSYYQCRVAHWVSEIVLSLKIPTLKPAAWSVKFWILLIFLLNYKQNQKKHVKREMLLTIFNLDFCQSESVPGFIGCSSLMCSSQNVHLRWPRYTGFMFINPTGRNHTFLFVFTLFPYCSNPGHFIESVKNIAIRKQSLQSWRTFLIIKSHNNYRKLLKKS